MSIACNSQIGVSSSDKRRELAYMFTEYIKADIVATFLDLVNNRGTNMPHFTKKQVYKTCVAAIARIHPTETYASLQYFCLDWRKERSFMKVRKVPLLTKCGDFERLCEALRVAATQGTDTTEFCHS